jgi:hypothetical protein
VKGVPWKELRKMMVRLNPRIVWNAIEKRGLGAMVYLQLNKHPDADPATGLWEIAALPNPLWFPVTPCLDTTLVNPETNKEHWVRGYASFFKGISRLKDPATGRYIFDRSAVKSLNIGAYRSFNSAKFRADMRERNKSDVERWNDKNKGIFRPMAGNGRPLGWKPAKLITY